MKTLLSIAILVLIIASCPSCNKETTGFKEEIKILKEENNFLKAENIALRKELEELYKRIEERDIANPKVLSKEKDASQVKETAPKKPEKTATEKIKKPEQGRTTR